MLNMALRWRFFFENVFSPVGAALASAAVEMGKAQSRDTECQPVLKAALRLDAADVQPRSRGAMRPSLAGKSFALKSEGVGNAGRRCTRSLVCKVESTRV
jgi:hypothetical protein